MLFCWCWAYRGDAILAALLLSLTPFLPPSPLSKALFYSSSTRLLLALFYPMLSPFLLDLYFNVLPMLSFPLLND